MKTNIIRHLLATPFAVLGVSILKIAEIVAGKKYTYRSKEVKDRMIVDSILRKKIIIDKTNIMKELTKLTKEQGIAFLSKTDAEDYYKSLVELIERLYNTQ